MTLQYWGRMGFSALGVEICVSKSEPLSKYALPSLLRGRLIQAWPFQVESWALFTVEKNKIFATGDTLYTNTVVSQTFI